MEDLIGMLAGQAQQTEGKGRDDNIEARLSPGEYVIPADVVSMIGDGNTEAGFDALDRFIDQIRMNFKGNSEKPKDGQALKGPVNASTPRNQGRPKPKPQAAPRPQVQKPQTAKQQARGPLGNPFSGGPPQRPRGQLPRP